MGHERSNGKTKHTRADTLEVTTEIDDVMLKLLEKREQVAEAWADFLEDSSGLIPWSADDERKFEELRQNRRRGDLDILRDLTLKERHDFYYEKDEHDPLGFGRSMNVQAIDKAMVDWLKDHGWPPVDQWHPSIRERLETIAYWEELIGQIAPPSFSLDNML